MATVSFASAIQSHHPCPEMKVAGATLCEVLEEVFAMHAPLRSYVLDDQGRLRHHVAVFLDGQQIEDPVSLSDAIGAETKIHVLQALSGG